VVQRKTKTYHDRAFAPAAVPVPGNVADPIPLAPDAVPDGYLRVQLDAHLEVPLEGGLGDRPGPVDGRRITLEAIHHGIQITFLGHLTRRRRGGHGSPVDGLMQDGRLRVMGLHRLEVLVAFQQMGALPTGVLGAHRLTIETLRGHALWDVLFE
jgi:hypothetical protein